MEGVNRKPDLSVKKEFSLAHGTKIGVKRLTVRQMMELVNDKKLSDEERGMRILAGKLLVNGAPIVYDDFLDCFSEEEANFIAAKMTEEEDAQKNV